MQIFNLTITESRERRVRVAAHTAEQAMMAAKSVLKPGARLLDCRLWGERDRAASHRALTHLINHDFLPFGGDPSVTPTVLDWIERAASGDDPAANDRLALAGMRVVDDRLLIGSPASIATLAEWFRDTQWAGSELLSVLALFDDALRTNRTFAGL